jgi:hypothetical protein
LVTAYRDVLTFVQHLGPTWRKRQHVNFAQVVCALIERGNLSLSDLARALPIATQNLHGRLKRLERFLDNPRLDEASLFLRWLKLTDRFCEDLPPFSDGRQILPLLLDTVYFEPLALLVFTVPCGSRGLPVALTTYHRTKLTACFPPKATWPSASDVTKRPRRGQVSLPASSIVTTFDSQNKIEEQLIDYVFSLVSDVFLNVIVADRGFARASLFIRLNEQKRHFAIRIDAQTHIRLPNPLSPGLPTEGLPEQVLGLRPGQRLWCPEAYYSKQNQVPVHLLGVWDSQQKEPWYIATTLESAQQTETVYRWRMRLESANRDEKSGVILREGGDKHNLTSVLHLHRLLLALLAAEWLCALTGLQAQHDLSAKQVGPATDESIETKSETKNETKSETKNEASIASSPPLKPARSRGFLPEWVTDRTEGADGPSLPPPVIPHRGPIPKLPDWQRLFAARGWLSYVRLGREVLTTTDFHSILHRMVRWLGGYLWIRTPTWTRRQLRYRLDRWWFNSS